MGFIHGILIKNHFDEITALLSTLKTASVRAAYLLSNHFPAIKKNNRHFRTSNDAITPILVSTQ